MSKELLEKRKCSQCLGEIPLKAKKCQHCGSKVKPEWKYMTKAEKVSTLVFFAFIFVFAFYLFLDKGDTNIETANKPDQEAVAAAARDKNADVAVICSRNEVETMLTSPKSADFPNIIFEPEAVKMEDGSYFFASYVDAQNSFGAMIRTNYACTAKVINAGRFECETECIFE